MYAGQHNDSRMNMALVMTAVHQGAVVANHTEVIALHKDASGKCNGARLKDNITGEEWNVKAKVSSPPVCETALFRLIRYSRASLMLPDPSVMVFANWTTLLCRLSLLLHLEFI